MFARHRPLSTPHRELKRTKFKAIVCVFFRTHTNKTNGYWISRVSIADFRLSPGFQPENASIDYLTSKFGLVHTNNQSIAQNNEISVFSFNQTLNLDGFIPAKFCPLKEKEQRSDEKKRSFVSLFVKSYSSAHKGCLDMQYRRRT